MSGIISLGSGAGGVCNTPPHDIISNRQTFKVHELVHKGFDGLDIVYKANIPEELDALLAHAKSVAASKRFQREEKVSFNGINLWVLPSGMSGGFQYVCTTGIGGESWFIKRPNEKDPYGIKVSVNAMPLAMRGLHWVRHDIDRKLRELGAKIVPGEESISRIDISVDLLVENFTLDRLAVVAPRNMKVHAHESEEPVQTVGTSSRITTITVGKNPGRQMTIYDKQTQIREAKKEFWWDIWNLKRKQSGLAELIPGELPGRIWRAEIRFYKTYLKEKKGISTFNQMIERLPELVASALNDMRYTIPTSDKHRYRWPEHPFWSEVRKHMSQEIASLDPFEIEEQVYATSLAEKYAMCRAQITGLLFNIAAMKDIEAGQLFECFRYEVDRIIRDLQTTPKAVEQKLVASRKKLRDLERSANVEGNHNE